MTFSQPWALWLLTLAVPVIAVHLYRGRVRTLEVPALFLWEQVLPAEDLRSGFKQLRHLAGLLVALAALATLVSAVADPTVRGVTREPRKFALVIDASPEMTRDRLADAKRQARDLLARKGRTDTVAILDASGVVETATADAERLERAIDRVPRGGGVLAPAALLEEAKAAGTVIVLTSRPWPAGEHSVLPVGEARSNVALAGAVLVMENGRPVARATAVNMSSSAVETRLEIRNRGRLLSGEAMKLGPREARAISFPLEPADRYAEGAWLELRLAANDPRPEDDAAGIVVPPSGPVTVVLVAERDPDPHLKAALDLLEQARVVRVHAATGETLESVRSQFGTAAVYVFDRVPPPRPLSDGGYLVIGGDGPAPRARAVDAVRIVDWDRDAVVHRWVDYSDVKAARAWVLKGEPLVTSDLGPVAAWGRRQGLAWIHFGFTFGVESGNFALTPSFPVFLRNAIQWLADEGRRAFPRTARAGGTVANVAPLDDPEAELRVSEVSGTRTVFARGGEARIPVAHPGLMKIEAGRLVEWVGVEPASPVDLASVPKASGPPLPDSVPWWRDVPWVFAAALIVLALLVVEWVLYNRGYV